MHDYVPLFQPIEGILRLRTVLFQDFPGGPGLRCLTSAASSIPGGGNMHVGSAKNIGLKKKRTVLFHSRHLSQ